MLFQSWSDHSLSMLRSLSVLIGAILGLIIGVCGLIVVFADAEAERRDLKAKDETSKAEIETKKSYEDRISALQSKNEELEERLKPRSLTNKQREDFKVALENSPKGFVRVTFVGSDTESARFAKELNELLAEVGFTTLPAGEDSLGFSFNSGKSLKKLNGDVKYIIRIILIG